MKNRIIDIFYSNCVSLKLSDLNKDILSKFKKKFTISHSDYNGIDGELKIYTIDKNFISFPRGAYPDVVELLQEEEYIDDFNCIDETVLYKDTLEFPWNKNISLYKHQKIITKLGYHCGRGTFQAGCGSGKTIALLSLIHKCGQPSLVIVPDTTLQKQWLQNIETVFGFKYKDRHSDYVGIIGDGKYDYKNKYIVVATIQSIYSHIDDKELFEEFGFVCMDECHLCGAMSFRTSIHLFKAHYRFGATATLFRNDDLGDLIELYIGDCLYYVEDKQLAKNNLLIKPDMYRINTNFRFNVNYKYTNWYMTLSKYLIANNARNRQIAKDIVSKSIDKNRIALIVSTRVNHCITLANLILKQRPKTKIGILVGDDINVSKLDLNNVVLTDVENKTKNGDIDIVFGVNKVKVGLDIPQLEDVYVVAPYKSQVITTQVVGRVMRPSDCFGKYKNKSDKKACVYDYVDTHIDVLKKQYLDWRKPIYDDRCNVISKSRRQNVRKR